MNLFGTIPVIGPGLVEWIRGDYGIADATLNRFFALHVVAVPLVLLLLVALHLVALRQNGSNNPDGIEIKEKKGADGKPLDGIPFHPYYTVKDLVGVGVFLIAFAVVVFFVPTFGGLFLEAAELRAGQSAVHARAHRAGRGTSRRSTRSCVRCRTSRWGALLMALSLVVLHRAAVARPLAGASSTRYRPLRWKICAGHLRRVVRGAGLPGPASRPKACMCCWRASSRCCTSRSSS